MDKEIAPLNHDQELALAVKEGKISQSEVDKIWRETEDLSPQTPITVRRAMIAIRNAKTDKEKIELSMQYMMSAATEIQAAMMRDESKFSHLVAGTTDIVRTLQAVNPLATKLTGVLARSEHMLARLEHIEALLSKPKRRWWQFWKREPEVDVPDTDEALAEEPYDPKIGSAW